MTFPQTSADEESCSAPVSSGDEFIHDSDHTQVVRRQVADGRCHVIKRALTPDSRLQLEREREILRSLIGVEGVPQLVQDFEEPESLVFTDNQALVLNRVFSAESVPLISLLRFAIQLTRIVAAVHRRGVLHRDINPSNILVDSTTRSVLLIDFGTACLTDEARKNKASPRELVGTLAYLAPEQSGRTGSTADERSDLYALGATLYEMICGCPPFEETDALSLIHHHMAHVPKSPKTLNPQIPAVLSDIVMRLLEKAPDRRYQSAGGLAHDLEYLARAMDNGETTEFALGERDFGARLRAPPQPVGRQRELKALRGAFDHAMDTQGGVLLVSGVPGVGKSSLIDELRPLVATRKGYFLSGKFDQYRQDQGADAAIQAFRSLGRQLLAEPEAELHELRERLNQALGPNVALVAAVNPEFATLLQTEPELSIVEDPLVGGRRLIQASIDLLRTVAGSGRPLVMVLDDLQWSTPAPIGMLDAIVSDESIPGLLLVGAYRDTEVDAAHPLAVVRNRWSQQDIAPSQIHLDNLPSEDLSNLLGEMLRLPTEAASELAKAVAPHTLGNPFDTVEFVNALLDQDVLINNDGWQWSEAAIQTAAISGNILGLVDASLRRLPAQTYRLLRLMGNLGGEVERDLLALVADLPSETLDQRLKAALDAGLLLDAGACSDRVRFRHDRVQQASISRLSAPSQGRLRLVLARRLAASDRYSNMASEQYLPVTDEVRDPAERLQAATLLHRTASNLQLINPVLMEQLLRGAQQLLDHAPENNANATELRLRVLCDWHAALYGLGRLDEADEVYDWIDGYPADVRATVEPGCVQIASLTNRGRAPEAIDLGLTLLRDLGLVVPHQPSIAKVVDAGLDSFGTWSCDPRRDMDYVRNEVDSPQIIATARLIKRLMAPAFFCAPDMLAWLCLESRRLWSEHGPCDALVGPLAHAPAVLVASRQAYDVGYRVTRHVLAVAEARGYAVDAALVRFLFAGTASHWYEPLDCSVRLANRAHEALLQGGDYQSACFSHYALLYAAMHCTPTLTALASEIDATVAFASRTRNDFAAGSFVQYRYWVQVLRGESDVPEGPEKPEDPLVQLADPATNPIAAVNLHLLRAQLAMTFDQTDELDHHSAAAMTLLPCIVSNHPMVLGYFLRACSLARRGAGHRNAESVQRQEFESCRGWLHLRANDTPDNFVHLLHLVDAEAAWARDDYRVAASEFDAAQEAATRHPRRWHQALIAERAAQFQQAYGLTRANRELLIEAHEHYRAWGALQKIEQLERNFPWLATQGTQGRLNGVSNTMPASTVGASAEAIDLLGILKASQALSSETSLDPLKERITDVLGAMSGATGVSIVLWHADEQVWRLLPPSGWHDEASLTIKEAGENGLLPLTAFRYFERTRELLLVNDATRDDRFSRDPYFTGLSQCSLLLMPLYSHGTPRAVLILENRLSRRAFATDRLEAVSLVAGQLTVSLDNAFLYASLERKVAERTEALAEANERLEALSMTDSLTDIANRRRFDQVLQAEWLRAQEEVESVGLAIIDIDEFKSYNDHYGHLAGDTALRQVATALNQLARSPEDLVARYGGEEFAVVLPNANSQGTRMVAERMRVAVESLRIPHKHSRHGILTISVGVNSIIPTASLEIEAELTRADEALYQAKNLGRNRVVLTDENPESQSAEGQPQPDW